MKADAGEARRWRFVDTGARGAADNVALDAALLRLRGEGRIPNTLRLLSFIGPAALIGFHQTRDQEVRETYCRKRGIEVNRRVTGGGAVYFDQAQLGWEIIAARRDIPAGPAMADLTAFLCHGAVKALRSLGVDAAFRPRNDIEVGGRKICGTGGAYEDGAVLFQGTLLVDFDPEDMIRALRVPTEKLSHRELNSARERVVSLGQMLGRVPGRNEIGSAFQRAFSSLLRMEMTREELTGMEEAEARRLLEKYQGRSWIDSVSTDAGESLMLRSLHRGRGGIIRAVVALDVKRRRIKSVNLTGDFFIDPRRAIFDLEVWLKDCPLESLEQRVTAFFRSHRPDCLDLGPEDFSRALRKALDKSAYPALGIPPEHLDDLTVLGSAGLAETAGRARFLLLPYCAKLTECRYRSRDGCDECGDCGVGDAYALARTSGLEPVSIHDYEHLVRTLEECRNAGAGAFIGCCCNQFLSRHYQTFIDCGMDSVLMDISDSTCYDLSLEQEAYRGRFQNQTHLKMGLLERVLEIRAGESGPAPMRTAAAPGHISCDVLVIGAGPAGSTAARVAAARGAEVLLLDRRNRIGVPPQCAGYVPLGIREHMDISEASIEQRVDAMVTFLPDGEAHITRAPGYIIRRDLLDRDLATAAREAGARIMEGCRALPRRGGATGIFRDGRSVEIRAGVVIGADGPRSATGRLLGAVNRELLHAAQWTVPLARPVKRTLVFLENYLAGGYGWLFPRGSTANAGVGITPGSGITTHEALKYFIDKLTERGLIEPQPLETAGGVIPAGGPVACAGDGIILAGDAAGLCHARTGAGILTAVHSGGLAGKAAADYSSARDKDALAGYGREIGDLLGGTLRLAAEMRRLMMSRRDAPPDVYYRTLRQTWPGFPEYGRHEYITRDNRKEAAGAL